MIGFADTSEQLELLPIIRTKVSTLLLAAVLDPKSLTTKEWKIVEDFQKSMGGNRNGKVLVGH